ncbi:hypothetical protein EB052_00065 [bacterium]|nr:hypothetical protein [bacterium]
MTRDHTRRLIRITSITIITVIILGYALFAFRDIVRGPLIEIYEPLPGQSIATSTILVRGMVLRVQDITLNDRPILIDQSGNFAEVLLLQPGYNSITIKGSDKFGRSVREELEIMRTDSIDKTGK